VSFLEDNVVFGGGGLVFDGVGDVVAAGFEGFDLAAEGLEAVSGATAWECR
jgi:hypothetical protein